MKTFLQAVAIAVLFVIYFFSAWAILHPHVNRAYRDFYINRSTMDWNPSHYPGSPEKGIDFVRPGLPDWVESTSGLSIRQAAGRWTDGDMAKKPSITFLRDFAGPVCVMINTQPGPSLIGKGFTVRMGDQARQFQFRSGGLVEYRASFNLTQAANKLEFEFPVELRRVSDFGDAFGDMRRVGMFLTSLRIVTGDCPPDSTQPMQLAEANQPYPTQKPTEVACQGAIDEIDGAPPQRHETVARGELSIVGWQAISGENAIVPDAVYVTLTDPKAKVTYVKARSIPRTDVNAYFKHPEMSDVGYQVTVDISQLRGDYVLGLARTYQGRLESCQSPKYTIRLERTR